MQENKIIPPHIMKFAKRLRFTGWLFLIFGLLVMIHPVAILFDPEVPMLVNGLPRAEFHIKLAAAHFAAIFPLLGAYLVFAPRTKIEGFLIKFDRFAHSFHDDYLRKN